MVRWISDHDGVEGNERADEEAKRAANAQQENSPRRRLPIYLRKGTLPSSISALKQAQRTESLARWARMWETSPRYRRTTNTDPKTISGSFLKLVAKLPKRHASLMIWLRTQHISLNQHLHRIKKIESPDCPHCPEIPESIPHFILECPHYARERLILSNALRRKAFSLPYLLADKKATPHLLRYINSTGRLKTTFGDVSPPTCQEN